MNTPARVSLYMPLCFSCAYSANPRTIGPPTSSTASMYVRETSQGETGANATQQMTSARGDETITSVTMTDMVSEETDANDSEMRGTHCGSVMSGKIRTWKKSGIQRGP
ncbi:unnamed protein product [Dibothriocephalus latus]|uniref:Uncharacterized protein n=1 Tax=Dibothriocephalus latus TaxID=60516 RepID=A0A3P7L2Z5_DIBLA|nr:unnamed protein product [Dibothriocephalus latus]